VIVEEEAEDWHQNFFPNFLWEKIISLKCRLPMGEKSRTFALNREVPKKEGKSRVVVWRLAMDLLNVWEGSIKQ
jgi:hypothetical protein